MQPEEREELDLAAFRYVAGEMTADEAGGFEGRLADDQQAREAVCRAVALAERLVAAAPHETERILPIRPAAASRRSLRSRALRAASWMTAGAAAALLAVYLPPPGTPVPSQPAPATQPERSRPLADAVVWARLQAASDWYGEDREQWLNEVDASLLDSPEVQKSAVPGWVVPARSKK